MTKSLIIITIGSCLCILGGVLMDCHVQATGVVALSLGSIGITFGPLMAIVD